MNELEKFSLIACIAVAVDFSIGGYSLPRFILFVVFAMLFILGNEITELVIEFKNREES